MIQDDRTQRGLKSDPEHPWRHHNLGRLLLASVLNWQDILVSGLQHMGFKRFRASHMSLLRHIDLGGTRISEIAKRARLTKQTVGEALAACEAEKLIKTVADPNDGRAKIVTFTKLGEAVIMAEQEVMERIDAELEQVLGDKGLVRLRRALATLGEWPGPFADEDEREGTAAGRQTAARAPASVPAPDAATQADGHARRGAAPRKRSTAITQTPAAKRAPPRKARAAPR